MSQSVLTHGGLCTLAALVLLAGCERKAPPPSAPAAAGWFEDATARTGLKFQLDPGPIRWRSVEVMGSGGAFLDFDNDGRLDIFLVQNAGPDSGMKNQLFHQEADGTLRDVSTGSGLDVAGWAQGVAVGDVNNDGLPDVLIAEYLQARLFQNLGGGKFREITVESGLHNPQWAIAAAFTDYDRDGWLDLVVVNYVNIDPSVQCTDKAGQPEYCGPNSFTGTPTRLFHNLGAGRFEDVTAASQFGSVPGPGLGVVCADFDDDGWPDILIANDARPNTLWMNQRDGTFKEEALVRGLAYNALGTAQANMGIALGDLRGDGMLGLYITHLSEENNVLWSEGPAGLFHDATAAAQLAIPKFHATGFGAVFADFDNDGWPDLAVANGRVRRSGTDTATADVAGLGAHWSPYAERNQLFINDGAGRFVDRSEENAAFCGTPGVGRGLAAGDFDNDGAVDLLFTAIAAPARLYRNIAPRRGHWISLRAVDPALGGRDAYGSEIRIKAGAREQTAWANPAYSYACSNDPRAHFGLGTAARVDAIRVRWPDGAWENFPGAEADQILTLRRGSGQP